MTTPRQKLPAVIQQQLSRLRMQIRSYVVAEGLLLAIVWLGIAYWVGLAIDYLPVRMGANEMPRVARAAFLVIAAIGLAYICYAFILRRLFVRLDDRNLALLLEKRFPQFQDSLITAVDTTADADTHEDQSLFSSMLERAVNQAANESAQVKTTGVFDRRPLARAGVGAFISILSIGLLAGFAGSTFSTWTSRFLLASDSPWPRQTQIEVLGFPANRTLKVAEGSNYVLAVRADAELRLPETCVISFRSDAGKRGRINMSRDGEVRDGHQYYRYEGNPFDGMMSPVTFDVTGFDHRLSDFRLDVVPSPSVSEIQLACVLPNYMDLPPRKLTWKPGLALPIGTKIALTAKSNKPLVQAQVDDVTAGVTQTISPTSDIGTGVTFSIDALEQTTTLKIRLQDTDGIESEAPYQLSINAVEDLPPQLDIRLRGIGNAITPDAKLPAEGEINDDYRINESWFSVRVAEQDEQHTILLQKNLAGPIDETLDLRRHRTADENAWELKPGQKIFFNVRATDFYDLSDEAHLGLSDEFPLDVVTADELLALLEARELGLKQRYEQILQELRDTRDQLLRLQVDLDGVSDESNDGQPTSESTSTASQITLRHLRVQRAEQQGAKSQQEVLGVALSFADIREELINNRIDTPERNARLKRQIVDPLQQIVDDQFPPWLDALRQLDESIERPEGRQLVKGTVDQANDVIFALEQVLQNMLELETFNDLVQLVRSIIEDQEAIQEKTRKEQKQRDRGALLD